MTVPGVETQPADVGVRFAVVVIPPATIVIDCVDGETYCGRRDAVARDACARGAGTVIVIVVVADLEGAAGAFALSGIADEERAPPQPCNSRVAPVSKTAHQRKWSCGNSTPQLRGECPSLGEASNHPGAN